MNAVQIARIEALERVGGSRWQKGGRDRVYANGLAAWYGVETTHYNSGNISSATLDGQKISNSKAFELISYLNDGKLWYDVPTGKWQSRGLDAGDVTFLVDAIEQAVAESAKDEGVA